MSDIIKTQAIPGLDHDLPDAVLGCDPGPEFCAFALVIREGDALRFGWAWYIRAADMVSGMYIGKFRTIGYDRPFYYVYEKMTARYGAVPGASVFDTARNSGIALCDIALHPTCRGVAAVSTTDWRVAFGGSTHISDSEVRAELINLYGPELDMKIRKISSDLRKKHSLTKPPAVHMRDALAVATSAFMFPRRGFPVTKYGIFDFSCAGGPDAE